MLGPDVAARSPIPTPTAGPDLAGLLGSQLVVTTRLGSTAGRVDAVGAYDGLWPYLEIAGRLLFLSAADQVCSLITAWPAGWPRTVAAETGPHPDTGMLLPHVERWCPTCAAFVPATPGPQEADYWTAHAHHTPEHLALTTDGGNTAVLHSPDAATLAGCWLTRRPGNVYVRLEPCDCPDQP